MKEAWLKCDVSNGMFPGECGASFNDENNEAVSLFCPEKYVNKKDGRIRVRIIESSGSSFVIKLPVESLNGTKIICVSGDQLRERQTA